MLNELSDDQLKALRDTWERIKNRDNETWDENDSIHYAQVINELHRRGLDDQPAPKIIKFGWECPSCSSQLLYPPEEHLNIADDDQQLERTMYFECEICGHDWHETIMYQLQPKQHTTSSRGIDDNG